MNEIRQYITKYYDAYIQFSDDECLSACTEDGLLLFRGVIDVNGAKPYIIMVAPEASFDRWSVNGTKYSFGTKEECLSFLKGNKQDIYYQAFKDLSKDYGIDIDIFGSSEEKKQREEEHI